MNQYQFLKQLNNTPSPGGDGVRQTQTVNVLSDVRTATGLVLDASTTNPRVAAVETNALVLSVPASTTAAGSFTFTVPKSYDRIADELKINVLVRSSGTTDTPTLNATVYRKRAGAALSAALTTTASAAIPNSTANAAERTVTLSGNGLLPGDALTVNLTTGAHTTDTVQVYSIEVQFKGSLVFADPTIR